LNLETKNPGKMDRIKKAGTQEIFFFLWLRGFQISLSSFPAFLIELLSV